MKIEHYISNSFNACLLFFIGIYLVLFISCCSNNELKNEKFKLIIIDSLIETPSNFEFPDLMPFNDNGNWGYANQKGQVVIKCAFDKCGFFKENRAWVLKCKKYGYIDSKGKTVIDFNYDDANNFYLGLAIVKKDNLYGVIDTIGSEVIPIKYESCSLLSDSTILVTINNRDGVVNRKGEYIIEPRYERLSKENNFYIAVRNGKKGIVNKHGIELVKCQYYELYPSTNNKFVALYSGNGYQHILIDINGRIIIPPYDYISSIRNTPNYIVERNNRYGVIDENNDTLVPIEYTKMLEGNTNLLAVLKNKWGFIDLKGKVIIPFQYDDAKPFINQFAIVAMNGKYGVINYKGETTIPFEYSKIEYGNEGIMKVWKKNTYGFSTCYGNVICDCIYDEIDYHGQYYTGFTKMGFGKFIDGQAIVGLNGQIGIINKQGKTIIPFKYHYLSELYGKGVRFANYAGYWGVVDSSGEELGDFRYDYITRGLDYNYCYAVKEMNSIEKQRILGYFNSDGTFLGKSIFDTIKIKTDEELVLEMKQKCNSILFSVNSKKNEQIVFCDTLIGVKDDYLLTINNIKSNVQYQYFYDKFFNEYGPFCIVVSSKELNDKYYFSHGRIIKHVDNSGNNVVVSSAFFATEYPEHFRARKLLADYSNAISRKNNRLNEIESKINDLVSAIKYNIKSDVYKKGQVNAEEGENFYRSSTSYFDKKQKLVHKIEITSGECYLDSTLYYYKNDTLIFLFTSSEVCPNDNYRDARYSSYYCVSSKYYFNSKVVRAIERKRSNINYYSSRPLEIKEIIDDE